MYVYDFQRRAREYLLGQKLSFKSISLKYQQDQLEQIRQQRRQKKFSSLLNQKSEITIETQLNSTRGQQKEKAFLIKKSPDHYRQWQEKRKLVSIYIEKPSPKRQMSIKEYTYPEPLHKINSKHIMQTAVFKKFLHLKRMKTEFDEPLPNRLQPQFQRNVIEVTKKEQQISFPSLVTEHEHKLSGWSINTNESKF